MEQLDSHMDVAESRNVYDIFNHCSSDEVHWYIIHVNRTTVVLV